MAEKRLVGMEMGALLNLLRRPRPSPACAEALPRLSPKQWWVIVFIDRRREQDIFQKDIEVELHIRRSTASNMLQLMEKNGLVIREPVDYDGRLKRVVLTEKALALCARARVEINKMDARLSEGLTEDELATFFSILDKMKRNLKKA